MRLRRRETMVLIGPGEAVMVGAWDELPSTPAPGLCIHAERAGDLVGGGAAQPLS